MEKIKIGDSVYSVSRGEWKKGQKITIASTGFFYSGFYVGAKGYQDDDNCYYTSRFSRKRYGPKLRDEDFEDFVERPKFKGCTIRD